MKTFQIVWADDDIDNLLEDMMADQQAGYICDSKGHEFTELRIGENTLFRVFMVITAEQALSVMADNPGRIHAVITDGNFKRSQTAMDPAVVSEHDTTGLEYLLTRMELYPDTELYLYTGRGYKDKDSDFYNRLMTSKEETVHPEFLRFFCNEDGTPDERHWIRKGKSVIELLEHIAKELTMKELPQVQLLMQYHAAIDYARSIDISLATTMTNGLMLTFPQSNNPTSDNFNSCMDEIKNGLELILRRLQESLLIPNEVDSPFALAIYILRGKYELRDAKTSLPTMEYIRYRNCLGRQHDEGLCLRPTANCLRMLAEVVNSSHSDSINQSVFSACLFAFIEFVVVSAKLLQEAADLPAHDTCWELRSITDDLPDELIVKSENGIAFCETNEGIRIKLGKAMKLGKKVTIIKDKIVPNNDSAFPYYIPYEH